MSDGYTSTLKDSGNDEYQKRLLIGTATTGLVRVEWVNARYGQVIPANWSALQMTEWVNSFTPLRYQVADAQNLIVKAAIEQKAKWLLFIEHDVVLPPAAFMTFHQYTNKCDVPVVSGLYFTRSRPSEPVLYRGRGNGCFADFKLGDKVWADGVPTGCLLIHMSIIQKMWEDSPEYQCGADTTRRVFDTPRGVWFNPETNQIDTQTGTSDLDWCDRVMAGRYFEKAGWPEYQKMEHPFLCDTSIFCKHIDMSGEQYP